ncbi:hypothetical protein HMF8227_02375 [Saliniradius amylolyticus]|uniref:Portal protein n=1 Tax=Saliniradius amylolyticus TaxID=2183582 RepID=A0A2S2E785_9ALTE|nr:hypothetical protein [Saliniradius amylolyticus]AWL12827.1 hypothetical protein HMF8227_02375 [Saliniradius amylolyticus]
MNLFSLITRRFRKQPESPPSQPTTETGKRPNPENAVKYLYDQMFCDPELRSSIQDIRQMDKLDARVKKVHKRMARDATKGGLRLIFRGKESSQIQQEWEHYERRLQLNNRLKLESDARGAVMEGNLALQWVVDNQLNVVGAIRMPVETLVPQVTDSGVFKDPQQAYRQVDPINMTSRATFALWQLTVSRLDPDNFDDMGSLGRPYLDATRSVWQKLTMTEEDLVIRRRTRAPQRFSHVLEGASNDELEEYEAKIQGDINDINTDFFSNRKGGVTALGGDSNLDQIADVAHLLDTFFAGAPAPKGLFGYVNDLARDVLEDLKADYFEEIDYLQDVLAFAYEQGFRLQLLLKGINPDSVPFTLQIAERKTETRNQRADLALKYQAIGVPDQMVVETTGLDYGRVKALREQDRKKKDVYPDDNIEDDDKPKSGKVSITPGNAPKKESAIYIKNGGK